MHDDELEPVELKEIVEVVTTAKLMTEVVTAASATITAVDTSIPAAIITAAPSAARRRKGVKLNSNVAFLEKTKEQMEEEDSKALKRASESQVEKAAKKQKLDEEVAELKKRLQIVLNDKDDVYTEATPLAHLEVLWQLVKERFASPKPKNFSYDFLLTTLTYMFEKPDVQAQVWKSQRSVHGLAKRRYPLTRFTLDQMLNNVRLEVEEESKVSMELLRFGRQQQQEGFRPE
nr:hypothetical protein [Tanacetum cinerariifolium]